MLSAVRAASRKVIAEFKIVPDICAEEHGIRNHIDSTWRTCVKQTHFHWDEVESLVILPIIEARIDFIRIPEESDGVIPFTVSHIVVFHDTDFF